jgi:hypothetical protein
MIAKTLKSKIYPALLAGTARQQLSFSGDLAELASEDVLDATLNALSLTGQALRFERPLPPANFAVEAIVGDKRPLIADSMRRPLLRLLKDRRPSDDLALALAWAFGRCKLRPHPFDLPKIDAFVRSHAEHLGLTAQHWAQQRDTAAHEPQGYFDADDLDETIWTKAPPARRARFIAERRRQDETAARTLVESVWEQETAETRVRLLAALETGLNTGDRTFLEGLAKDRAPRVRALAQRFLARISGHGGEHPALRACLERISRSTTGLLKKRPALTLELPATVKEHETKAWIRETFAEVGCEELAGALQLTETQLVEAAEKDAKLSLALALMATQDRHFDLLAQLTGGQLDGAWEQLSQCGAADLSMMSNEERLRWAGILIHPYKGNPPASYPAWSWLHRSLEGPAPELLIESVLRSPRWLSQLLEENKLGAEWMEMLVAVSPSTHWGRLRALIAPLDPELTRTALPLLDILDSMEKVGHHEQ